MLGTFIPLHSRFDYRNIYLLTYSTRCGNRLLALCDGKMPTGRECGNCAQANALSLGEPARNVCEAGPSRLILVVAGMAGCTPATVTAACKSVDEHHDASGPQSLEAATHQGEDLGGFQAREWHAAAAVTVAILAIVLYRRRIAAGRILDQKAAHLTV